MNNTLRSFSSNLFKCFYFNIDDYLTFKRIFKCNEIEELKEKDYECYVKHVCGYSRPFSTKKPLQDEEFFVLMYANGMQNSAQELSLTTIISFAMLYPMI